MSWVDEFKEGFMEDLTRGTDDNAKAFYRQRELEDKDDDAMRLRKYFSEHPVVYRTNELLNRADPLAVQARSEQGFGPKKTMAGKLGQLGGAIGHDVLNDRSRSLYWLLNAAQASGSVINELAVHAANPDLFGAEQIVDANGNAVSYDDLATLSTIKSDIDGKPLAQNIDSDNKLSALVRNNNVKRDRQGNARLRNYRAGTVTALGVPAGFAINQGLGLMTPFGGYEGYEAAVPSEADPSKTANPVLEVAAKYIMGRTGNLLPYDEFSKVRPDVSRGEYNAYKAFKYDKDTDLNPFDDGKMTLPTGIIKTTDDGIHGAEVQFLGRSLPVNTALIPFAGAVAGAAAGVRPRKEFRDAGRVDRKAGRRGVIGGAIGTAAGMAVGNLLEQERRNRNAAQNAEQGF